MNKQTRTQRPLHHSLADYPYVEAWGEFKPEPMPLERFKLLMQAQSGYYWQRGRDCLLDGNRSHATAYFALHLQREQMANG